MNGNIYISQVLKTSCYIFNKKVDNDEIIPEEMCIS